MLGYDKITINRLIRLDLPFQEATGLITHDIAKPHHIATLTGPPTWADAHLIGGSDLGILQLDGATQYLQIPAADSLDLDFTGDFSLAAWVYPIYGAGAMIIMCRNTTDLRGWAMFLYDNPTLGTLLSLRTNQAGSHSECYAAGFPDSEWQLVGYARDSTGLSAICYKNGMPVTTVLGPGGIIDPVACGGANKLLVGVQEGEASNFLGGYLWRLRAWNRQLSALEWMDMFHMERSLFGV